MSAMNDSEIKALLSDLGIEGDNAGAWAGSWIDTQGPALDSLNPTTGEVLARIRTATASDYEKVVATSVQAFEADLAGTTTR